MRLMGEIRIYTDESVDVAIAQGLQRRGVEAFSARDRDKLGLNDDDNITPPTFSMNKFHPNQPPAWGSYPFYKKLGVKSTFDLSGLCFQYVQGVL